MVTVVPPDNKSLLVEQREKYQHHDHDQYRSAERVKDVLTTQLAQLLAKMGDAEATTERIGGAGQTTAERIGGKELQTIERTAGDGKMVTVQTGKDVEIAVEKIGAAGQLTTERVGTNILNNQQGQFSNTQNLLINGFKDARYDAATLTASLMKSQVEGFKDGRYDAAVNAAAIAKQVAECCCELKEKITAESQMTRDLVSSIDARRADRELVDAKNEITLLKLQVGVGPLSAK